MTTEISKYRAFWTSSIASGKGVGEMTGKLDSILSHFGSDTEFWPEFLRVERFDETTEKWVLDSEYECGVKL